VAQESATVFMAKAERLLKSGAALVFAGWLCAVWRDAVTIRGMVSPLAKRVLQNLQRRGNLGAGARVGVAVSGGADSVALLLLLTELRKSAGIVLCVLHVNHVLRGKASDADERFVSDFAKRLGCEFYLKRVAVSDLAKKTRQNLEDTARRVRYEWFARAAEEHHLTCVATAHTADDQAETVTGHILRGTGLAGLRGIHWKAGVLVRPLLAVRRQELRDYLRKRGQRWREDASNRDVSRTRARIRKQLLPLLEKRFQPQAVKHLCELAERAAEVDELLDEMVQTARRRFAISGERGLRIRVHDLLNPAEGRTEPRYRVLSALLVRALASEMKKGPGQLTAGHIEAILALAERGENGKELELPGGLRVCREHDTLFFCRAENLATRRTYSHQIEFFSESSSVLVPQLQCVFRFRVIDWPPDWRDTNLTGTVLDRDRLKFPLVLRNWWPGDRLHPVGRQGPHKLKHLLSGLRLSRWERESWPVLASAGQVAWTRGLPVAAELAPNERTRAGIVIAVETAVEAEPRAEVRHAKR
jgi:tRNA(Ile)-lysidine synthase